jgi:hypothetical protein
MSSDLRNHLLASPTTVPQRQDLVAINIRRGRDHGLAHYNTYRRKLNLPQLATFSELTTNATMAQLLTLVYGSPDRCDLYVCGLMEVAADSDVGATRQATANMGPTFKALLTKQFEHSRDGDRFWFENTFTSELSDDEVSVLHTALCTLK